MGISLDERYKVAVQMHAFQHQRWNQWSLFFFGSIVSVFALWSQLKSYVPLWVPALIAFLISVGWIFSAMGIRAMNRTWEEIVKSMEDESGQELKPHHELTRRRAEFNMRQELLEILRFWQPMTLYSVSRHLIWFGLFSAGVFLSLFVFGCFRPYLPDTTPRTTKTTTTTTTTTTAAP